MKQTESSLLSQQRLFSRALLHSGRQRSLERWTSNRKVVSSNPRADKVQICRSAPEQAVNPYVLNWLAWLNKGKIKKYIKKFRYIGLSIYLTFHHKCPSSSQIQWQYSSQDFSHCLPPVKQSTTSPRSLPSPGRDRMSCKGHSIPAGLLNNLLQAQGLSPPRVETGCPVRNTVVQHFTLAPCLHTKKDQESPCSNYWPKLHTLDLVLW
jgi:hypothetical protein